MPSPPTDVIGWLVVVVPVILGFVATWYFAARYGSVTAWLEVSRRDVPSLKLQGEGLTVTYKKRQVVEPQLAIFRIRNASRTDVLIGESAAGSRCRLVPVSGHSRFVSDVSSEGDGCTTIGTAAEFVLPTRVLGSGQSIWVSHLWDGPPPVYEVAVRLMNVRVDSDGHLAKRRRLTEIGVAILGIAATALAVAIDPARPRIGSELLPVPAAAGFLPSWRVYAVAAVALTLWLTLKLRGLRKGG